MRDTVHFPCCVCFWPWMTDGNYPVSPSPVAQSGNVINQLHLLCILLLLIYCNSVCKRGPPSISPALIQVSCSTSDFFIRLSFPFFSLFFFLSKISFFLLTMMGLHALSAHLSMMTSPHQLLLQIYCNRAGGITSPRAPHATSRARCLKNVSQIPQSI